MNIMENKRVTAIAALMAVAFIGICYYGYGRYTALKEAQAQISQISSKMEDYASEDIPPTGENSKLIVQAAAEVDKLASELEGEVGKYAAFCMRSKPTEEAGKNPAYAAGAKPTEFQANLKTLSDSIGAYAKDHNSQLLNGSGDFGMSSLKTGAATEVQAPYYNFLLYAMDGAVRHIIDAGAPSIERVYYGGLPEESITARKQPAYFPLEFQVAFTAKRSDALELEKQLSTYSVLPQVLNKLSHDPHFFYIVTGMAVNTRDNLPMPATGKPADAAVTEEGGETVQKKAVLLTGKDNEQVYVHLNIQVLYFTTDKF